jgi:hypothetical protein
LVVMLGEMLQWKNFHDDPTKPPFPWDAEAARWSREYRKKHPNAFPLDKRELLRPERVKLVSSDSSAKDKVEMKSNPKKSEKPKVGLKLNPVDPDKKPTGLVKLKPLDLLKKKPNIRLK